MFSPTNQKYINVSLFYFHDVTPHSQPLTPQNKKKFSWTVHKKFKPIVHEKKCLIKWQILIDKCKFMSA